LPKESFGGTSFAAVKYPLAPAPVLDYIAPMRVLIAPDKFKGTLTAQAAAVAIARGWKRVRPHDVIECLPISDGGDGFGRVLADFRPARRMTTLTVNAAGRRQRASWWWDAASQTAIIESAGIIGLALLPPGQFHPFDLDTRGLAAVLRAAARRGARQCLVGVGGSATNDAGFGLARGLGWRFLARDGQVIDHWRDLSRLATVQPPAEQVWPKRITVAVDVQNPLLGPRGCTRVYGPQKGLQPADFPVAEAALRRLARVMRQRLRCDVSKVPGAGAAGGLGFGLAVFAGAQMKPGFELVAREAGLAARLRRADLVITGEGRLDASTLMGKGVGELATRCRAAGVPCVALAGTIADRAALTRMFVQVGALTDLTTPENACREPRSWLEKLAVHAARHYFNASAKLESTI
jgi:glycerate kinase